MRVYVLMHESERLGLILRSFHDRDRAIFEFMRLLGFYHDYPASSVDYPVDMHAQAAGFRAEKVGEEWKFWASVPTADTGGEQTVLRGVDSEG